MVTLQINLVDVKFWGADIFMSTYCIRLSCMPKWKKTEGAPVSPHSNVSILWGCKGKQIVVYIFYSEPTSAIVNLSAELNPLNYNLLVWEVESETQTCVMHVSTKCVVLPPSCCCSGTKDIPPSPPTQIAWIPCLGHSEPAPTSAPSTGCPLFFSCGWSSTEFIFGSTLVINSVRKKLSYTGR
jgi:hypothetical protein